MHSNPDTIDPNLFSVVCPCCSTVLVVDQFRLIAPAYSKSNQEGLGWWFSCGRCNCRWWCRSDFLEESETPVHQPETLQTLQRLLAEFPDDAPVSKGNSSSLKVSEFPKLSLVKTPILEKNQAFLLENEKNPLFNPRNVAPHLRKIGSAFFPSKKKEALLPKAKHERVPKARQETDPVKEPLKQQYSYKRILPEGFSLIPLPSAVNKKKSSSFFSALTNKTLPSQILSKKEPVAEGLKPSLETSLRRSFWAWLIDQDPQEAALQQKERTTPSKDLPELEVELSKVPSSSIFNFLKEKTTFLFKKRPFFASKLESKKLALPKEPEDGPDSPLDMPLLHLKSKIASSSKPKLKLLVNPAKLVQSSLRNRLKKKHPSKTLNSAEERKEFLKSEPLSPSSSDQENQEKEQFLEPNLPKVAVSFATSSHSNPYRFRFVSKAFPKKRLSSPPVFKIKSRPFASTVQEESFHLATTPVVCDSVAPPKIKVKLIKKIQPSYIAVDELHHQPIVLPFEREETVILPPLMPSFKLKSLASQKEEIPKEMPLFIKLKKHLKKKQKIPIQNSYRKSMFFFFIPLTLLTASALYLTDRYQSKGTELWERYIRYTPHPLAESNGLSLTNATYTLSPNGAKSKLLVIGEVINLNHHSCKMQPLCIKVYKQKGEPPFCSWNYFHFTTHILPQEHILFQAEKEVDLPVDSDLFIDVELIP